MNKLLLMLAITSPMFATATSTSSSKHEALARLSPDKATSWVQAKVQSLKADYDAGFDHATVARDAGQLFKTVPPSFVKEIVAVMSANLPAHAVSDTHKALVTDPENKSDEVIVHVETEALKHALKCIDLPIELTSIILTYNPQLTYNIRNLIGLINVGRTLTFKKIHSIEGLAQIPNIRYDKIKNCSNGRNKWDELSPVGKLNFENNGLTEFDPNYLVQWDPATTHGRPACPEVTILMLANNQLTDFAIEQVLQALPKLHYLDLTNNPLKNPQGIKTAWQKAGKLETGLVL